jgi:hypothetical protein
MKGDAEVSETADSRAGKAPGRRRGWRVPNRRSGGVAVLVAAAALALAACSRPASPARRQPGKERRPRHSEHNDDTADGQSHPVAG